jgi:quercetin dioxygenase-like cupin family protein
VNDPTDAAAEPLPTAPDGRRAAVIHEADLAMHPFEAAGPAATYREPIDERTDCRRLVQRVIHLTAGRTADLRNERSEEVVYLAEGATQAIVDGTVSHLEPGTALFIPEGATHRYNVSDGEQALVISVLSPPPARNHEMAGAGPGGGVPPATVRERDQPRLLAGEDRFYKLLIDPTQGCRTVTQFVGFIEKSRAPFHTHTY